MKSQQAKKLHISDSPGVYFFKKGKEILYIGKATSLKDRVLSYFSNDPEGKYQNTSYGASLLANRGPLIVKMTQEADNLKFQETNSVLEALILEANLIKKYQPKYNVKEKDDRSFNFVIITSEDFPRVLIVRGREIEKGLVYKIKEKFGPFTDGTSLRLALKIIRKIFPFRDKCEPLSGKPCFNKQIGLCPGVCAGTISKKDYSKTIKKIKLFLSGKTASLEKSLEKEMKTFAKKQEFEKAGEIREQLFALKHIADVALVRYSNFPICHPGEGRDPENQRWIPAFAGMTEEIKTFRIEAYDVAHLSGTNVVGAMTVFQNGEMEKSEYRKFKIKNQTNDDLKSLQEMLERRLNHKEWQFPNIIVVDGGQNQINIARKALGHGMSKSEVVSVLKGKGHKPKAILGNEIIIKKYKKEILLANSEAHRFAIKYHRQKRGKW